MLERNKFEEPPDASTDLLANLAQMRYDELLPDFGKAMEWKSDTKVAVRCHGATGTNRES